ncbi:hypothetical protein TIFTF001_025359 [Ficus carica]|uniref:Uncharacterized protein n=1 Tax=Ficus carica TaxID=3494 RepID=A0AA88AMU3_FICCA|nr:hypothetical protein TIFTF001_025359 [Ficus carica]
MNDSTRLPCARHHLNLGKCALVLVTYSIRFYIVDYNRSTHSDAPQGISCLAATSGIPKNNQAKSSAHPPNQRAHLQDTHVAEFYQLRNRGLTVEVKIHTSSFTVHVIIQINEINSRINPTTHQVDSRA